MGLRLAEADRAVVVQVASAWGEELKGTILFADIDLKGAAVAAKAAFSGYTAVLYSPNPYVVSSALKYRHLLFGDLNRLDLVRLVSEERLRASSTAMQNPDLVWVSADVITEAGDRLNEVMNLVRQLALSIETPTPVLFTGLSPPGCTKHLVETFTLHSRLVGSSFSYAGCPHLAKAPYPFSSTGDTAAREVLEDVYTQGARVFDSYEEAEHATLRSLAQEYVSGALTLEMLLTMPEVPRSELADTGLKSYSPETRAAVRHMLRNERSSEGRMRLVWEAEKIHRRAQTEAANMARRALLPLLREKSGLLRILAVADTEDERAFIEKMLPSKRCKLIFKLSEDILDKSEEGSAIRPEEYEAVLLYTSNRSLTETAKREAASVPVVDINNLTMLLRP